MRRPLACTPCASLLLLLTLMFLPVSYAANEELEDRWDLKVVRPAAAPLASAASATGATASATSSSGGSGSSNNGPMVLVTVLDGHGGFQAADYCKHHLLSTAAAELAHGHNASDPAHISAALTRAFQRVDREFLERIKPAFALGFGDVAHVGSCAIAAAVTRDAVVVANAGDCRAVVGRLRSDGSSGGSGSSNSGSSSSAAGAPALTIDETGPGPFATTVARLSSGRAYDVIALSYDHNARLPRERNRLAAEHPGEPDIVVCQPDSPTACYVKGRLQPTRAIGDGYLKYSELNGPPGSPRSLGRHIKPPYTPPYITATPEVRYLSLDAVKDKESFLILACDGVWDVLSSEEAVAFVAADAAEGNSKHTVAERMRDWVLTRVANENGMSLASIQGMRPGKGRGRRRNIHDDITIVVLWFGGAHASASSSGGSGSSKGWKLW